MMVKTNSEAEITSDEYANLSYGDILAHYRTPYKRNNDITPLLESQNQHISSTTTRVDTVSKAVHHNYKLTRDLNTGKMKTIAFKAKGMNNENFFNTCFK